MTGFLVGLYPAAWRRRFGEEFEALLEERPLGPFDVADVLVGAIDAHLHFGVRDTASLPQRGFPMSVRIGGLAAMATGVLWVIVTLGLAGLLRLEVTAGTFLGASITLLIALVGLTAFQARANPIPIWSSVAIGVIGSLLSDAGLIGMLVVGDDAMAVGVSLWGVWLLGLIGILSGSAMFSIVTWQMNVLSRPAAAALASGSIVSFIGVLFGWGTRPDNPGLPILAAALFVACAGWVGLGFRAVRGGRLIPKGQPA